LVELCIEELATMDTSVSRRLSKPTSRRVLIVDDEPDIRELFAEVLSKDGWRVDTAASGEEGLERFQSGEYDLITLDCAMPGMSGLDLHQRLSVQYGHGKRISPLLPSRLPPILVITGWFEDDEVQKLIFQERIVGIVKKPVSCDKLKEVAHDLWIWETQRRSRRNKMVERLGEHVATRAV
jgi:CheY-like chemotaxis protein